MHDPDKGVSDFSDFLKQRMGEVREFSSDWSKFNHALHRYQKSVSALDLDSICNAAPVDVDTDSYIRSVDNMNGSLEEQRLKRVTAPHLKIISAHRSSKSKNEPDSSVKLDREIFLKKARNHQHLVKTDFMHKAQAQFLQQQFDNLQKIIVEKGPLEVDPVKSLRRMEIACTLPWDESLRRGYRENPTWLRQQRQTIDIFGDETRTMTKSNVATERGSKAVLTVTFDIEEPESVVGSVSPPKHALQRTTHLSDPTLNRVAMQDAVSMYAKYAGSNFNLEFCPPTTKLRHMSHTGDPKHTVHTSIQDKAVGIRTPTLKNSSVTKRGLSKDWRER